MADQKTTPSNAKNQNGGADAQSSSGGEAKADVSPDNTTANLEKTPSKYSDPVFKQISVSNGRVNRMTKDELKAKLAELRMDTRGVKEILKKRLKFYYQKQKLCQARVKLMDDTEMTDYLVVIDFEATCEENVEGYPHEIIEFPAILVSTRTHIIVDEFREFCKPKINPKLTSFCTTLTGIQQEQVDSAEYFPEVLKNVEAWMKSHSLGDEKSFTVLTDGPWDMSRFLHSQCNHSRIPFPRWARRWINVRKCFRNFYGFRSAKLTIMLESLGMEFEGKQHSGIDDAKNIARVAMRLLSDGAVLQANERIFSRYLKENKRVCVDVVSCREKGSGEAGSEEEEELEDAPEAEVDSEISYMYNGQYETKMDRKKKSEKTEKAPSKLESTSWADEVPEEEEDVSDLLYLMKLKGKSPKK